MPAELCIVDFNFLLCAKETKLINECTLYCCRDGRSQTFHIATDKFVLQHLEDKYSTQLKYNQKFFHGIPSEYGGVHYSSFCNQFRKDISKYDIVLTKGNEKVDVIKNILKVSDVLVQNLGSYACPSVPTIEREFGISPQRSCIFHQPEFSYCTAFKTGMLSKWVRQNSELFEIL
jgi:hypothetical protein